MVSAPAGTPYTLWWDTPKAIQGFTFVGTCGPDDTQTKTANAYDAASGKGVCFQAGWYALTKGVAGKHWHVFEADVKDGDVKGELKATCGKAP